MATEMEIDFDFDIDTESGTTPVREPRIPNAVWVNRPAPAERGAVSPASALLGALAIAVLGTFGVLMMRGEAGVLPVSPARADAVAETTGNGPTGYFPDAFPRVAGEVEPLPPTF